MAVNRLEAGFTFDGRHSTEWDMLMKSYEFPVPKAKEVKESVAYSNGSYDFSFLYGKQFYEDRQISFDMLVFNNSYQDRGKIITDIRAWLLGKPKQLLTCDVYEDLEFSMKCVDISEEILSYGIVFKIAFEGNPLARNIITNEEVL